MLGKELLEKYEEEKESIDSTVKNEAELKKYMLLSVSLSKAEALGKRVSVEEYRDIEQIDIKHALISLESFTGDIKDYFTKLKNKVFNKIEALLSKLKQSLKLESVRADKVKKYIDSKALDGINEVKVTDDLDDLLQGDLRVALEYDILNKILLNKLLITNTFPLTLANYFTSYNVDSKTDIERALKTMIAKSKVKKDEIYTLVNNLIFKNGFTGLSKEELILLRKEDALFIPSSFYKNKLEGLFITIDKKRAIMKNISLTVVEGNSLDVPKTMKISFIKEVAENYSAHIEHYADAIKLYEKTMNKLDDSFKILNKYKEDKNQIGIDFITIVTTEISKYSVSVLGNASRIISLQRRFIYASLDAVKEQEKKEVDTTIGVRPKATGIFYR